MYLDEERKGPRYIDKSWNAFLIHDVKMSNCVSKSTFYVVIFSEGVIGSTTNPDSIGVWAYSYHDCFSLINSLYNLVKDDDATDSGHTHKEESKARIKSDAEDRKALRERLALCMHPLVDIDNHPTGLLNIATNEIVTNSSVNVDRAIEIGAALHNEFKSKWPEGFDDTIKNNVVLFTANAKTILVDGQSVKDCGVFYSRAYALHVSGREDAPSVPDMLNTELAPTATALFDENGYMRSSQKSALKTELAVERTARNLSFEHLLLDGGALLWSTQYPHGNKATVQSFIDSFRKKIRTYQKDATVYLALDR